MSSFTNTITTKSAAAAAPEVESGNKLMAYFAEMGITTFDQVKSEISRWGMRFKTDPDFPGLGKICHDGKTDHTSPIYHFSNGVMLEETEVDGEKKLTIAAHSFDRMTDLNDEFHEEGPFRTELIPELAEPGEPLYLMAVFESTEIMVTRRPDGTLVYSTRRMIDAGKAKWSSWRSLKALFLEALGPLFNFDQIQTGYTYTFTFVHPENNRAIPYPVPKAWLTGIRNNATDQEQDPMLDGVDHLPAIPVDSESYLPYIESLNGPAPRRDIVGYIVRNKKFKYQKFTSPLYKRMTEIYGNCSSLLYRYFELRTEPEKLREFLSYFGHMSPLFEAYERNLIAMCIEFYKIYHARYNPSRKPKNSKGEILSLSIPKAISPTITQLHKAFIDSKAAGKPIINTEERVFSIVSKYDPPLLCTLYNFMVHNESGPVTYEKLLATAVSAA